MADKNPPLFAKFFTDKHGRRVIGQKPNLPIIGWFVCKVLAYGLAGQPLHAGLQLLSAAFLFTWAYLELTSGASYFRKALGLIVLAWVVMGYFR
jgi:hypothetical protein